MNCFVTGATGFIGARVVRCLVSRGHEVRCLVHRSERASSLSGLDVETVHGEIGDRGLLCSAMAGSEWVFHLAAHYDFWTRHPRDYRSVNVDGTRAVLETALESGVRKVVAVSTFAVYGEPGTDAATAVAESTPEGPRRFSRYAESKHEADQVAWELRHRHGLPLVMVYPGAVLGEDDPKAAGAYLRGLVEHRLPARFFESAVFPFVYVGDVAEIVVRAAESRGNEGERYFAVGESLTFGEINRLVAEISGEPLPRLRLPDPLVIPTAAVVTLAADLVGRPPLWGMALDQMRTIRHGVRVDGSKAERELGIRYTPIRAALARALASPLARAS